MSFLLFAAFLALFVGVFLVLDPLPAAAVVVLVLYLVKDG